MFRKIHYPLFIFAVIASIMGFQCDIYEEWDEDHRVMYKIINDSENKREKHLGTLNLPLSWQDLVILVVYLYLSQASLP